MLTPMVVVPSNMHELIVVLSQACTSGIHLYGLRNIVTMPAAYWPAQHIRYHTAPAAANQQSISWERLGEEAFGSGKAPKRISKRDGLRQRKAATQRVRWYLRWWNWTRGKRPPWDRMLTKHRGSDTEERMPLWDTRPLSPQQLSAILGHRPDGRVLKM